MRVPKVGEIWEWTFYNEIWKIVEVTDNKLKAIKVGGGSPHNTGQVDRWDLDKFHNYYNYIPAHNTPLYKILNPMEDE